MGLTRDEQLQDTIYATPDGRAFVANGLGRYWYDNVDMALYQHGYLPVVGLTEQPED